MFSQLELFCIIRWVRFFVLPCHVQQSYKKTQGWISDERNPALCYVAVSAYFGKFVKADIFEHPVSFSVVSHANVGSPEEALSASLNKFGTVDIDYMRTITDSTAEELLTALQGRIYYNPLVTGYEIKDRFIAGNVIEKAERIEAWIGDNPENERMPEVKQALEALKDAEPPRIAFEDLDFNFGERWIPTGVYAAYMSRLFDTEVKIAYSASMDEFSVACSHKNFKIWDEFCVKGYSVSYTHLRAHET